MRLRDVRVGTLEYAVNAVTVAGRFSDPDGRDHAFSVGDSAALVPQIDLLRDELRNPAAVSSGAVPRLKRFMAEGGRFLPDGLDEARLDVLVVVPHGLLHDLPLHLVLDGDERPVGARIAMTYASSPTLFARCASRNPTRQRPPDGWTFGADAAPTGAPTPRSLWAVAADVLQGNDALFWDTCRRLGAFVTARGGAAQVDEQFASRVAMKAAFRQKESPDVLCVMAHGSMDLQDHELSGLFLKPDMGVVIRPIPLHGGRYFDFRDLPLRRPPLEIPTAGPAEILTIAEMEIDAKSAVPLVLLLACSAGCGQVLQGDEPASLAETFLHVGASSVVAAQWDSDVTAVRAWMEHFFTGWIELGLPKALAARHALHSMVEDGWADRPELYGVMTLRGDWL